MIPLISKTERTIKKFCCIEGEKQ